MRHRALGKSGFSVTDVGCGLWGMSGWSGSDDQQSLDSLQLSVDTGCNFFDTAWAYGEGKSDGLLGKIMQENSGKRLYAASKIPPGNLKWPALVTYKYSDVFSSEHVFKYADMIRKQLQVDTIDLLQFHVWSDAWVDVPEFRETKHLFLDLPVFADRLREWIGSHNDWRPNVRNFSLALLDRIPSPPSRLQGAVATAWRTLSVPMALVS